jgi:hypothetical protein
MAHGIIRTDNVKATKNGNIRSARYYVNTTATKVDNGALVQVDVLLNASANREIFKAVAPSAITVLNLGVVATPEIIYSEALKSTGALGNFENAAGENITVLMLSAGDIISLSDDCITPINDDDDVPAVGSYVIPTQGSVKWAEAASLGGTESLYGKIIARELFKKDVYLNTIEIIKAN